MLRKPSFVALIVLSVARQSFTLKEVLPVCIQGADLGATTPLDVFTNAYPRLCDIVPEVPVHMHLLEERANGGGGEAAMDLFVSVVNCGNATGRYRIAHVCPLVPLGKLSTIKPGVSAVLTLRVASDGISVVGPQCLFVVVLQDISPDLPDNFKSAYPIIFDFVYAPTPTRLPTGAPMPMPMPMPTLMPTEREHTLLPSPATLFPSPAPTEGGEGRAASSLLFGMSLHDWEEIVIPLAIVLGIGCCCGCLCLWCCKRVRAHLLRIFRRGGIHHRRLENLQKPAKHMKKKGHFRGSESVEEDLSRSHQSGKRPKKKENGKKRPRESTSISQSANEYDLEIVVEDLSPKENAENNSSESNDSSGHASQSPSRASGGVDTEHSFGMVRERPMEASPEDGEEEASIASQYSSDEPIEHSTESDNDATKVNARAEHQSDVISALSSPSVASAATKGSGLPIPRPHTPPSLSAQVTTAPGPKVLRSIEKFNQSPSVYSAGVVLSGGETSVREMDLPTTHLLGETGNAPSSIRLPKTSIIARPPPFRTMTTTNPENDGVSSLVGTSADLPALAHNHDLPRRPSRRQGRPSRQKTTFGLNFDLRSDSDAPKCDEMVDFLDFVSELPKGEDVLERDQDFDYGLPLDDPDEALEYEDEEMLPKGGNRRRSLMERLTGRDPRYDFHGGVFDENEHQMPFEKKKRKRKNLKKRLKPPFLRKRKTRKSKQKPDSGFVLDDFESSSESETEDGQPNHPTSAAAPTRFHRRKSRPPDYFHMQSDSAASSEHADEREREQMHEATFPLMPTTNFGVAGLSGGDAQLRTDSGRFSLKNRKVDTAGLFHSIRDVSSGDCEETEN